MMLKHHPVKPLLLSVNQFLETVGPLFLFYFYVFEEKEEVLRCTDSALGLAAERVIKSTKDAFLGLFSFQAASHSVFIFCRCHRTSALTEQEKNILLFHSGERQTNVKMLL